ncbi:O-fucosyltransferase 37 [Ipomoea triloba]|uniref:O-fucosyltransferase 37 n=1 Tax=Ipomoea triloba TaxID=35885 RepID=UPI00125D3965|nr:O-fucosyltransferase 37 [Ipomoea triloba]
MAVRTKYAKNTSSFIALNPSFFSHLLSLSPFNSMQISPRKASNSTSSRRSTSYLSLILLFLLVSAAFLAICTLTFATLWRNSISCSAISSLGAREYDPFFAISTSAAAAMVPLPPQRIGVAGNVSGEEREFWQQPEDEGYRPCLHFSYQYRKAAAAIAREKRRFLVVVVSGGLNQQRNQIVDAVVIARILEASLVVPVLQVNRIWRDESEFSEIFDVEHFKKVLKADVRIVSSLPSSHLMSKQTIENQIPFHVSPIWIRARFFRQLNREGLLILKGLESKLSKNLPPDLQKLRCKVAFHALRFAGPIQDLSNRIARRMWDEGPYIAIHLRLEKDVWIRSGCPAGLGAGYDRIISKERESHPEFLTGKLNITNAQRRLAGLCPLNASEMARLLKALGAPRNARVYVAGGEPFGGKLALQALQEEFPNLMSKHTLAREDELTPYLSKASVLAAIDYIVSLNSDVFVTSHGGNMARALEGHRAYLGHRKYIKPNKRMMFPYLDYAFISDTEFSSMMRKLHKKCQGQPQPRTNKRDRDVLAYPVPECMCK